MSDEQSPFDELLRSPWAPTPGEPGGKGRRAPWSLVAGIAIGALAVIGGYAVASGGDATSAGTTTTTTEVVLTSTPSTGLPVSEVPVDFPEGFVPVSDMTAVKPEYMVDTGDQLIIAFTTATRRGLTSSGGFDGGDWVLTTATGAELTSSGIVYNTAVVGGFSVQFDKEGDVTPRQLRLVDTWAMDSRDSTVEEPFTGIPTELSDIEIDLGGGVSLSLDLSLGESDGEATWTLDGAGDRGGSVQVFVVIGDQQNPSAYYFDNGSTFDFGSGVGDIATQGVTNLTRQEIGGVAADTMSINATVTLIGTLPVDATFDLEGLPTPSR